MEFKFRDYQEEAIQKGLEVLRDPKGRREICLAVTAAGKSLIIGGIAKELTDGKVLCLQPDKNILEQNLSKIESFGIFPSVYSASMKRRELSESLIYATPKSVSYEILKDQNIKYVIWDEVDFASRNDSHTIKMLKQLGIKSCLGLTASPIHIDASGQDGSVAKVMTRIKGAFFTDICYVVSAEKMIKEGHWSPIKYYDVYKEDGAKFLELNTNQSDFTDESKELFYQEMSLSEQVRDFLLRMPENENALVFVPSIACLEELQKLLPQAVSVHSKMNDILRDENTKGFLSGKYKTMICVSSLNVGFDFPRLFSLVDCSPTNSVRIIMQRYGRILRTHPDKDFGRVICFSGNYRKFGSASKFNFENIKGYGWGLFSGDKLLTDVPAGSKEITTKEYLLKHRKPKSTQFEFTEEHNGSDKLEIGRFKNKSLKQLYFRNRWYLKYLYESGYTSPNKKIEETLKLMFG